MRAKENIFLNRNNMCTKTEHIRPNYTGTVIWTYYRETLFLRRVRNVGAMLLCCGPRL